VDASNLPFKRDAIRPFECWSAGWQLIKEQYWLLVGITLVAVLLGSLAPMGILMGAMLCGLDIVLLTLMRGQRVDFNLLFKGFDYFVPGLIVTAVRLGVALLILLPLYIGIFVLFFMAAAAGAATNNSAAPIALMIVGGIVFFVLIMALSLALGVWLLFAYPLIVDRKLSGWDACRLSARAVRGNLQGAIGLLLLCVAFGFAGLLACYVGVFLVLPIQFAALAVAYRQVFPDEGAPLTIAASPPAQTVG
jgi:uncharacterized membrane protein